MLLPSLAMLTTLMSVCGSLGAPLLVTVSEEFGVPTITAQWMISLPYLTGAAATPIVGWVCATRHRRPMTILICWLVCAGGLLGALPLGLGAFLTGRGLQGLGLTLLPVAIAVARDSLPRARRARAIALLSVTNVVGGGVGFPLSALMAELGGLRSAYWLAVLTSAITLALIAWTLPPNPSTARKPVDWLGVLLLSGGAAGALYVLTRADEWGLFSPRTLVAGGLCALAALGWALWSLRARHPIVDLRLAGQPLALSVHVTSFIAGAGMYVIMTVAIVMTQTPPTGGWGLGLSVLASGWLLFPYAVCSVAGSRVAGRVQRRLRAELRLPLGMCVYLSSAVLLLVAHRHLWQLILVMAIAGVAGGMSFAQMPGLLVSAVPVHETGSAIGFSMVVRYLGFSLGTTLAAVILSGGDSSPVPPGDSFRSAVWANAAIWSLTLVVTLLIGLLARRPAPPPARHGGHHHGRSVFFLACNEGGGSPRGRSRWTIRRVTTPRCREGDPDHEVG